MNMKKPNLRKSHIEALEARIAPAALGSYAKVADAEWLPLSLGSPIQLFAGQGLSTLGDKRGSYLMFVEQGSALVFTQDYNGNDRFDANEITGIAAGDGLRLISFVDIHGDIVTNLKRTEFVEDRGGVLVTNVSLSLSDSDNNPANDTQGLKGDGRVLLNNAIDKIELRPLTVADLSTTDADGDGKPDGDQNGDGLVDNSDVTLRQPPKSTFSIYGSIYAGRGFGADDGGLIIDPTADGRPVATDYVPMVHSIRVGTAVSGQYYSFGVSGEHRISNLLLGDDLSGLMAPFTPPVGAAGGSINTVKSITAGTTVSTTPFTIGTLMAGNGGAGGAGGNVMNVAMVSDDTSGYSVYAGNGGTGRTGGDGGAIINFSDSGSFTGLVILSGGDGGQGTIGSGGNAGDSSFTTLNIKGNVHIDMGDGGNGFVNGGKGSSLAKGIFTEPGTLRTKVLNGWGTTHLPDGSAQTYEPRLGVTRGLDFNGDGEGDLVYATSDASLLMVMISDPRPDIDPADTGWLSFPAPNGFALQGIYLDGPRNAKALSAGDVNGDGHTDIVAASRDFGGTGDLVVFLAKFEDLNNDGVLSSDEDLDADGFDDFIGFYEGRHSTIPVLGSESFGTNDLAIGDFDGDGRAEIVVGSHEFAVFMTADLGLNPATGVMEYTGQFYYDYGRKAVTVDGVTFPAARLTSSFLVTSLNAGSGTSTPHIPIVLEATTLHNAGDSYDVVIASAWSYSLAVTLDWSVRIPNTLFDTPAPVGVFNFGIVDLDRGPGFSPDSFRAYDLTTVDFDGDGNTDVAGISLDQGEHQGFMNGSVGTGLGGGNPGSGGGNQAGNYFELPPGSRSLYTIRAGDGDGDGLDDLILSHEIGALFVQWAPGPDASVIIDGIATNPSPNGGDNGENETNHSFADAVWFDVNAAAPSTVFVTAWVDYGIILPGSAVVPPLIYNALIPTFGITETSLAITAGNGGSGLVGRGGAGGFLGGSSTLLDVVDPLTGTPTVDPDTGLPVVSLNGALQISPTVTVQVQAGKGGDGFSHGGNGGSISGTAIYDAGSYTLNHSLRAGDGGRGVFGTGGAGGNLISNSIFNGVEFVAGNGGVGKIGGPGGSVVGSGASYDVYNSSVAVIAGNGGLGTTTGGKGGSISNFHPRLPEPDPNSGKPTFIPPPAAPANFLYYQAGDGGSAVTGRGGDGGSVTNSSPVVGIRLTGEVIAYAGDGGLGNSGGNGGSISDFSIRPDGSSNNFFPKLVTLLAGKGGDAFTGKGGNGGNLSNLNVVSKASGNAGLAFEPNAIATPYRDLQDASRFRFSRLIAGEAGASAGNDGGLGGSINNVVAFSPLGSYAIVSGAGGDGFRKGGNGGNTTNIRIDFGGSASSKALIASGEGGDASSFIVNPIDGTPNQGQNAYGGRVGKGGNGGSIVGITQKGALDPRMDIVAGDGGSTIHYGTVLDKKGFVGIGGSVREVRLACSLGNSAPAVALKNYNDVHANESFGDFVRTDLYSEELPVGVPPGTQVFLDDVVGNVGVVVGSAGRNKSYVLDPENNPTIWQSVPSKTGINGSLVNVFARNLISAVAGSVDRIASIQTYQSVTIVNEVGGDKNQKFITVPGGLPNPVDSFADRNGNETTSHEPVLEGYMVDGAVVAKKFLNGKGQKVPPPLNGFIR